MKNHLYGLLLLLSATLALPSCRETDRLPEPANESIPLIIPEVNPQKSFFAFEQSRESVSQAAVLNYTRPVFEFVVNPSQGYAELQTVEVYKSFRRGGVFGPRVKVTDLTSFPATVSLNSQEALTDLFLTSPTPTNPSPSPVKALPQNPTSRNRISLNLVNPEAVVFTFEYVLKDGRRIVLTPVSTAEGSVGVMLGTTQVFAPYAAVAVFK